MSKVKCKGCQTYVNKESAIRVGLSSWCSNDCRYSEPAKKKPKGTKKLAPKPKAKRIDYGTISHEVYDYVIKADGNRCRHCGGTKDLAVHHIYYRSEAKYYEWCSQPINLITLCNYPCHLSIIHRDKKKYQPLCLDIVKEREWDGNNTRLIKDIK